MTLYDAIKLYLVYIQGLRLNQKRLQSIQRCMRDVLNFYGERTLLQTFDDAAVLEYIRINDPFDCDPIHQERGDNFTVFIDWLMHNKLIPAWASQLASADSWVDAYETL